MRLAYEPDVRGLAKRCVRDAAQLLTLAGEREVDAELLRVIAARMDIVSAGAR